MRQSSLTPLFTEAIPEDLETGLLYVSIRYRIAAHLCACGCGLRVVTPIKPAKWSLTYDGETISLWPSIGRWQHPCKSHYVIRKNKVIWQRQFDDDEIAEVALRDVEDVQNYFRRRATEGKRPRWQARPRRRR